MSTVGDDRCMTCLVLFPNDKLLHDHYRGDWHIYNSNRRSANLAPISYDTFESKRAALKVQWAKEQQDSQAKVYSCELCNKKFRSEPQLSSHMRSKKHIERAKAHKKVVKEEIPQQHDETFNDTSHEEEESSENTTPSYVTVETLDSYQSRARPEPSEAKLELVERLKNATIHNLCCLDLEPVSSVQENIKRMYEKHGFEIPAPEFLVDLAGLLNHIKDKVLLGQMCIYCDQGFGSVLATVQHMNSKGHGRLPFDRDHGEDMAEYDPFYDMTKEVYDDDGCLVRRPDFSTIAVDDTGELVLPSGKRLGHRSLNVYYTQNSAPEDTRLAVVAARQEEQERLLRRFGYLSLENGNTANLASHAAADVASKTLAARGGKVGGQVVSHAGGIWRFKTKQDKRVEQEQGKIAQRQLASDMRRGEKNNVADRLRVKKQFLYAG